MCAAQRYLFVWDFVIQVELPVPILKCYFPLRHGATEGKTVTLLIPNATVTSVSGCISEYRFNTFTELDSCNAANMRGYQQHSR